MILTSYSFNSKLPTTKDLCCQRFSSHTQIFLCFLLLSQNVFPLLYSKKKKGKKLSPLSLPAMTEVLHSPSHFASSPRSDCSSSSTRSSSLSCVPQPSLSCPTPSTDASLLIAYHPHSPTSSSSIAVVGRVDFPVSGCEAEEVKNRVKHRRDQLSLLAFLVTLFRKSLITCKSDRRELCSMEIGWPTNVRHVAHVTFDRFNGFLGLPVEFEPEVPRRAPSASTTVFGVSTESMQLSYDSRGNSVPTILLLMQQSLYAQGGLQAEGIFRINGENSQEEYVRDQLNRGVVPEGIDVHCLAGLIKAWFRELPTGILDSLSSDQVMQCQTDEECAELVSLLPLTEAALLDWAINLMADVVQWEHLNKMNERNVAMVFAPNMTQMADPLTALMYAVQVMNFLKTLILKTLRERGDSVVVPPGIRIEPSGENGNQSPSESSCFENIVRYDEEEEHKFSADEPLLEANSDTTQSTNLTDMEFGAVNDLKGKCEEENGKRKNDESSKSILNKGLSKLNSQQSVVQVMEPVEKSKRISNVSRIDTWSERIEAWW